MVRWYVVAAGLFSLLAAATAAAAAMTLERHGDRNRHGLGHGTWHGPRGGDVPPVARQALPGASGVAADAEGVAAARLGEGAVGVRLAEGDKARDAGEGGRGKELRRGRRAHGEECGGEVEAHGVLTKKHGVTRTH